MDEHGHDYALAPLPPSDAIRRQRDRAWQAGYDDALADAPYEDMRFAAVGCALDYRQGHADGTRALRCYPHMEA